MDAPSRQPWLRAALLVGAVYLVIGRVFALPATHVRAWRLAAWIVSGIVFAAHIWYEHLKLRHPARTTALHAAAAAAMGAFALALVAALRAQALTGAIQPRWLLALVLWPLITGVPAFLAALVVVAVLARVPRSVRAG